MNVSITSGKMKRNTEVIAPFDRWKRLTSIVSVDSTKYHPNQVLPINLRVPTSGTHFYKMGFSNFKNDWSDRHWINHPLLVFIIPTIHILKFIYTILTPDLQPIQYLYIGDFGFFMDMRVHLNLTAALVFWMAMATQLIQFYNYFNKREPTYLRVFDMMAGRLTPHSIGYD